MSPRRRSRLSFRMALVIAATLSALLPSIGLSGEVLLKNGTRIEGKPARVQGLTVELFSQSHSEFLHYPIWLIHTGMQRYFVPDRQVQDVNLDANPYVLSLETFKLPPHQKTGRSNMLAQVGTFSEVTEFDQFGRRRVTVRTPKGPEHIVQGVKTIDPRHLTIEGLTHQWEFGIATSSVPPQTLDAMIRNVTDQQNPDDRMAIARFYIQAEMYPQAAAELDSIARDFPELKPRVEELVTELRSLQARELLTEIRTRKAAGQIRLTSLALKAFPTANMHATVLRDVRDLQLELESLRSRYDQALMLLGQLQTELDEKQQAAAEPLRATVRDRLDAESLGRLDAFLKLHTDPSLTPAEKLGLAYSGWVVGSANAVDDLDLALRLWKAQFLVLEYLRSEDSVRREELVTELKALEGIGPERVGQLIPHLPPIVETAGIQPGVPHRIEIPTLDSTAPSIAYSVLLPQEYTPNHRYPLIIALRPAETSYEQILAWWGGSAEKPGQSQRHGYIVIAPEYAAEGIGEYDYGAAAHTAVLESLYDARQRFNVDSDRVFLAGHGMGADAVFDVGMSHPDVFAGAIPINGLCDHYCNWYWQNSKTLPWYIVSGELSRSSLQNTTHAALLNKMMRYGHDMIYAEYIGRGYESYFSEIHKLFDWMNARRREPLPKEINVRMIRPGDNRFYWVQSEGLLAVTLRSVVIAPKPQVKPTTLEVTVSDGRPDYTAITVTSGAQRNILWLNPEIVSFEKRLRVRHSGKTRFNDFLEADTATMLEDLRTRGDRQRLFWAKVVVE